MVPQNKKAIDELSQQVSDTWKDLNEDCLYVPDHYPSAPQNASTRFRTCNQEVYRESETDLQTRL